ncbi:MAG: hypothetical protein HQ595_02220, partial [Candidatus Omnitrophica bacterium]|nr:hypothetical protein [Candidatus Omnitrophota bacterium]
MPRMFDLLRTKVESPSIPAFVSGQKQLFAAAKSRNIDNLEAVQQKYDQSLEIVTKLLQQAGQDGEQDLDLAEYADQAYSIVDAFTNQLILGDSLLEIIAGQYQPDEFLPRHLINVCILSLALGLEMKLNKSRLHILGVAALLHDLGILSVRELVAQPRALTPGQLNKVRRHVTCSIKAISQTKGFSNDTIRTTIIQHHERANGLGYPEGLAQEEI